MKLSQFTVIVNHYPRKDCHLLYHTLSRAMIEVDKAEWRVLQNLSELGDFAPSRQTWLKSLAKLGFIVPRVENEGKRYLKYLNGQSDKKGGALSITLLTNLQRCPLACSYCYQQGTHTGPSLDGDLSEACLTFIKRHCEKLSARRLFISYYGSEPLSNKTAIVETAAELQRFCREKRIRFSFGMVTSGVLLTEKVVCELLPLGFTQAQITIDGNQQTHDASPPFQSGKGTYAIIMKNLARYAGRIHTTVLSVVDESRIDAAYELIDTLAEDGYVEKRVRVTFSPVLPAYDEQTLAIANQHDPEKMMMTEKKMRLEIAKLFIYAAERGLVDDLRPDHSWCAMQRHDERHLVLTPEGKIYTCPSFIGRHSMYEAGTIHTGIGGIDTHLREQYIRSEKCLSCRYLPICADCRADALHQKGDITAENPKESHYDQIVPQLIQAHYRLRYGSGKDKGGASHPFRTQLI